MLAKTSSLYWFSLLCLVGFVISTIAIPLVLNEDPAYGLNVWQSMQKGSGFNLLTYPAPQNPLQSKSVFISWWSPGQYLLPVGWSWVTGWRWERSAFWLTIIFTGVGLWGWQKVWQQRGFRADIVAWSIFLLVTSRLTTINFLNYTGGETLIFGGTPWVIYAFYRWRQRPLWLFLGMLSLSLLCFILKTSSSITLLSLVVIPAVEQLIETIKNRRLHLTRLFWTTSIATGLAFVVYYAITQWLYLSHGTNPTTHLNPTFAWSFPVLDLISFPAQHWLSSHDFVAQLMRYSSPIPLTWIALTGQIVALLMLSWTLYVVVRFLPTHYANLALFLAFYGTYTVFLGYFYGRGAEISFEVRHFKVVAFLFLPLFLEALCFGIKWLKYASLGALLVCNTAYGLVTFVIKKMEISHYPTINSGFAVKNATQADVAQVRALNQTNGLMLITDPTLALELNRSQKYLLTYPPQFAYKVGFAEHQYHTQGKHLYVVHSKLMASDVNAPSLTSLFPGRKLTKIAETTYYNYYESPQ